MVPGDGSGGAFCASGQKSIELIYAIIEDRCREEDASGDLLGMLLAARNTDGSRMTPRQVRDNLMSIVLAGHETTASELAWAFQLLGAQPEGAEQADRGDRRGRRRGVPDRDDPGGAASSAGVPVCDPARGQAADRDRRLDLSPADAAAGVHLSRAPRPGALSRAARVPPRALPRERLADDVHVAAVGRRSQALSRPAPGDARDEDRAAHGARDDDRAARREEDRAPPLAERDRDPTRGIARGAHAASSETRVAPENCRNRESARNLWRHVTRQGANPSSISPAWPRRCPRTESQSSCPRLRSTG